MEKDLDLYKRKAAVLIDALPYLRDFNQKIVVICYLSNSSLTGEEEQEIMRDITTLQSVGMKPVIVHDTRMGVDKFRENKRIAKLVEFCGTKAIGVCGIDEQTLHMTIENGYIPVITPNDIDTEYVPIDPVDTAREVAALLNAEKLVYVGSHGGVSNEIGERVYSVTESELKEFLAEGEMEDDLRTILENAVAALDAGVARVHILDAKIRHAILIELFSIIGAGTVFIGDDRKKYSHEER